MVLTVIKNWDNKNWLSSKSYIKSFNNYLTKKINLNPESKILDIGCGRGKILGALSTKLKLKNKPLGIDITSHKDKDKRIKFKKINASKFFQKNKIKFDLILIKQTIHLLSFKEIKKLLNSSKKNLNKNGKIFIFTLDTNKNELPTFKLMKTKLMKSLKRDRKILKVIEKLFSHKKSKFTYQVNIKKRQYLNMIQKRYMSILLSFSKNDIKAGMNEINHKYEYNMKFTDKLICIIL